MADPQKQILDMLAADLLLRGLWAHSQGHLDDLVSQINSSTSINATNPHVQRIVPYLQKLVNDLKGRSPAVRPRTPMLPPIQTDQQFGGLLRRIHEGQLSLSQVMSLVESAIGR